jgi:hypothetical protein
VATQPPKRGQEDETTASDSEEVWGITGKCRHFLKFFATNTYFEERIQLLLNG